MKKLSTSLILSVFVMVAMAQGADTYPFPLPNNWDCNDFANYTQPVDPWDFYEWQCTSFVAWKVNEANGDVNLSIGCSK